MPWKITALFTGNQSMKTASTAYQYVLRILGKHPVPKKNVVYFECSTRNKDNMAPHGYYTHKEGDILIPSWERGTWNIETRPQDNICPYCGGKVVIHERGSRIFRFMSENLPGDTGDKGEGENNEVKNAAYPEFKKWLPPFLIKRDIRFRDMKMVIKDPLSGMEFGDIKHIGEDIIVEFVSYSQTVQSGAGVQRLSCVAEGQRVLMSDGVWRNIEDIKSGDALVCETLGGFDNRQRTNIVDKSWYSGEKEVLKFHCQKGVNFEVTGDHLVMVPGVGKSRYVRADELKVGGRVRCRLSGVKNEGLLPDWLMATTAVLLGDGTITNDRTTPKFTCKDGKIARYLEYLLPDHIYLRKQEFKNGHADDYFISDKLHKFNTAKEFLGDVGLLGCDASNKFVPDIIFQQSDEKIALFLRFIFACDGWASGHSIGYCSISERLVRDIWLLLRRFGIRSTIQTREFENGWSKQWHISISQAKDVIEFSNKIGITGKHKAVREVQQEAERRIKSRLNTCHFSKKQNADWKPPQSVVIKSIEKVGVKPVYDISMKRSGWDEREKNGVKKQRSVARSPRDNFLIQGGVVVHNCWADEELNKDSFNEQLPRLLAEDGDFVLSLTPANKVTWTYDEIFEKANVYFRTEAVCDFLRTETDDVKQVEFVDNGQSIGVIMAATDDNPTLGKQVIEEMFSGFDDPDDVATRRYGLHRQHQGRIFKSFDYKTHFIRRDKYFPRGIPTEWVHARGVDYHPRVPWACGAVSLSPYNEAFIWAEFNPSPEKLITEEICDRFAEMTYGYKFVVSLIDPEAEVIKKDQKSVFDDINRIYWKKKKNDEDRGGSWMTWNTKGDFGRREVQKRLKNALRVGKPFNNKVVEDGVTKYLPTLWVLDTCKSSAEFMRKWRWDEWADNRAALTTKDLKDTPQQKWSHFNMVWEAIFKDHRFRAKKVQSHQHQSPSYFQGRR